MLKVVGASWLQTKISSYILGILGLLAIVAIYLGELERIQDDGNYAATVFYNEKTGYQIQYWGQSNQLETLTRGVARAFYRQDIDTTGWAQLEIETNPSYPDQVQAFAAGMLEGALTCQAIQYHLENTVHAECAAAEKDCDKIKDQLLKSVNVDKTNVAVHEDYDPFWHQVGLFYSQIEGIQVGWEYEVRRSQQEYTMERADLYWLNAASEIREIRKRLNISSSRLEDNLPGLASALIRVVGAPGEKKLFVAHNTAGNYNTMLRIMKRYHLHYHLTDAAGSPEVPGSTVQFPGYPAAVSSHDEMYTLSGNDRLMSITGTVLNNFNKDLWKNVNITEQVPIGPRLSAANRLATNVSDWIHIMARNNSGTACKQWMVVDLKQLNRQVEKPSVARGEGQKDPEEKRAKIFKDSDRVSYTVENNHNIKHTIVHHGNSGKVKNMFWLMEQVPGYTHSGDLSATLLKQGYWATYGLPYFKDIVKNTHHTEKEAIFGPVFSYSKSPRALTFKEAASTLTNMTSIINLMRTNNMTRLANITDRFSGSQIKAAEKIKKAGDVVCDDGTIVRKRSECVTNERMYWINLAARGDLARQYKYPYGVIDTKVLKGDQNGIDEFAAISGPTFDPSFVRKIPCRLNKGNVATASIDSNPKEKEDERINEDIKVSDVNTIPPFTWSRSQFSEKSHNMHPDTFNFGPFNPHWVW